MPARVLGGQEPPLSLAGRNKGELSSLGLVESSGHKTGGDAVRVRILLQVAPEDGAFGEAEEVATFEKGVDRLEEVGLSLAEGKTVLGGFQRRLVGLQAAAHVERRRHCETCGRRLRSKGDRGARISGTDALIPTPVGVHAMRTDSGRPSSSIRFKTWTAIATSVA